MYLNDSFVLHLLKKKTKVVFFSVVLKNARTKEMNNTSKINAKSKRRMILIRVASSLQGEEGTVYVASPDFCEYIYVQTVSVSCAVISPEFYYYEYVHEGINEN